jgi:hypothetical protein
MLTNSGSEHGTAPETPEIPVIDSPPGPARGYYMRFSVVNEEFAALAMTLCGHHKDTVELSVEASRWFLQKVVEILIGLKDSGSYEYLRDMIDLDHQPKDATFEDLAAHPFIVAGSPEQCIRKLEGIEALGADQFITFQQMGRIPHERVMESIQLYGDQIIPHFKAKAAAVGSRKASGA